MKRLAIAVMLIGVAVLIYALSSDIAVDGIGGRRIANVGLMHDRMVNIVLSGFVILGGLLLRIFGANMAASDGGYVKAIDDLPIAEFRDRLITTILAAACAWLLLVMYVWPTTLAMFIVAGAIGWYTFQPQATYSLIKKVWLAVMLLALILAVWHAVAILTQWINFLTLALISEGVELVGSGNFWVVFASLVLGPLVLSAGAFVFAVRKAKTA